MKPSDPNIFVLYHNNCADGFGAAYSAWTRLGDRPTYVALNYGDEIDVKQLRDAVVYILDFSFPKEMMLAIMDISASVIWLDHHKTAFEMWLGTYHQGMRYKHTDDGEWDHYIELDDLRSGAMITWDYFHLGISQPTIIQYIDDRDRWQFKLTDTKAFAAGLWAQRPWSFEQWGKLHRDSTKVTELIFQGQMLLDQQAKDVEAASRRAMPCAITLDSTTYHGVMVNAVTDISELGHVLAKESGTYALIWYMDKDGVIKCSLRSVPDIDASAIAKSFGGGGHKNAAGFTTNLNVISAFMKT